MQFFKKFDEFLRNFYKIFNRFSQNLEENLTQFLRKFCAIFKRISLQLKENVT